VHLVTSIALLGCLASISGTGRAQERNARPDWSLHPLTLRQPMTDEKRIAVWIGVRNERRAPQRTCVQSEGYIIGTIADPYVFAATVTHACSDDTHFTIVLPGETYFYGMTVDLRKDWKTGPLELSLFLVDFDDSGVQRTSEVEWKGQVSSLVAAGKDVAPKSQPR
jgi:hypothetical protein